MAVAPFGSTKTETPSSVALACCCRVGADGGCSCSCHERKARATSHGGHALCKGNLGRRHRGEKATAASVGMASLCGWPQVSMAAVRRATRATLGAAARPSWRWAAVAAQGYGLGNSNRHGGNFSVTICGRSGLKPDGGYRVLVSDGGSGQSFSNLGANMLNVPGLWKPYPILWRFQWSVKKTLHAWRK